LHAVWGGHLTVVKRLLQDFTYDQEAKANALGAAVDNGHVAIVRYLLPYVTQDAPGIVYWFLKSIVPAGESDVMQVLLDWIESEEPNKESVLRGAVLNGDGEILQLLLDRVEYSERAKEDALNIAVGRGDGAVAQMIRAAMER